MALLDMCRKEGFQLVVAHMNYKKRDTADRDMELVRSYCARFHIPFEARLQTKPCVGNFQAFAREERYPSGNLSHGKRARQYEGISRYTGGSMHHGLYHHPSANGV